MKQCTHFSIYLLFEKYWIWEKSSHFHCPHTQPHTHKARDIEWEWRSIFRGALLLFTYINFSISFALTACAVWSCRIVACLHRQKLPLSLLVSLPLFNSILFVSFPLISLSRQKSHTRTKMKKKNGNWIGCALLLLLYQLYKLEWSGGKNSHRTAGNGKGCMKTKSQKGWANSNDYKTNNHLSLGRKFVFPCKQQTQTAKLHWHHEQ